MGRPSTYAPIIALYRRGVTSFVKEGLYATELGRIVLEQLLNSSRYYRRGFTAQLEEKLDQIAEGKEYWVDVISAFTIVLPNVSRQRKSIWKKLK